MQRMCWTLSGAGACSLSLLLSHDSREASREVLKGSWNPVDVRSVEYRTLYVRGRKAGHTWWVASPPPYDSSGEAFILTLAY